MLSVSSEKKIQATIEICSNLPFQITRIHAETKAHEDADTKVQPSAPQGVESHLWKNLPVPKFHVDLSGVK